MNAIMGEFAENGFSPFGHHSHMHDARLVPCTRLLPSGSLVGYVGVGGHSLLGLCEKKGTPVEGTVL